MRSTLFAVFSTLVLLLLSAIPHAVAQHSYNIDYITTENGLPSDGIKGLQWDEKSGFLWIATEGGMVRYDGQQTYLFHKENVPGINSDRIFPLTKNLKGDIYAIYKNTVFKIAGNQLEQQTTTAADGEARHSNLLSVYVTEAPPANAVLDVNNYDHFFPIDSDHVIICLLYTSPSPRD